jgi:uncharacterized phage infection (PIP) family protein YhgE
MNENEIEEDSGHFKMRLNDEINDDVEETGIPAAVDEMRLEKISTRVTIISIMIPVLIAIVLVIAYLDIKKRVVQTEDEGSMSFQNLSADLESRFSSLSLRQARLEEQLTSLVNRNEQALARIEVKLKKLEETTQALPGDLAAKKDLKAAVADVEKKLNNIADGFEESQGRLTTSVEQWRAELVQLRAALAEAELKLTNVSEKVATVEAEKMDKPAMELALSLEGLKIKQALKSSIDELSGRLNLLEKEMKSLKSQPAPPPSSPAPTPAPSPQAPVQDKPPGITEETINE